VCFVATVFILHVLHVVFGLPVVDLWGLLIQGGGAPPWQPPVAP
jgi:hypothetical protein